MLHKVVMEHEDALNKALHHPSVEKCYVRDHIAGGYYHQQGFGMLGCPKEQLDAIKQGKCKKTPFTLSTMNLEVSEMICGIIGDIYGAAGSVIAKYRSRTNRMHLKTMEGLLRNNMSCPTHLQQGRYPWPNAQFITRQRKVGRDGLDKRANLGALHYVILVT